jgi:hypothetical protein
MGTNYYRSPTLNELETRKNRLMSRIRQMELNVESVNNNFRIDGTDQFQNLSPWDEFTDNVKVHLGKRSVGWKFLWNFNEDKFFKDKESLLEFIKSGRVDPRIVVGATIGLDEVGDVFLGKRPKGAGVGPKILVNPSTL